MYLGRIVCSVSGHDKGCFMVVVAEKDDGLLVCDGKLRPLAKPKFKNIKHIKFTEVYLKPEQLQTNKSIRKAIYGCMQGYKEEA